MIAHLPADALASPHQPVPPLELARGRLGLVCSRVLTVDACAAIADAVLAARADWTPSFDGLQFTLGHAYYTHLEEGRADEYFAHAASSRALVDRVAPGLADKMMGLMSAVVQAEVALRPGWCGPGVHVFPASGWVAERGGDVHFDIEGLSEAQLAERSRALTLVVNLRSPEDGGGLRLWSRCYDGGTEEHEDGEPTLVRLREGDAIVFDSHRLHQIEPFTGAIDRLTATVHAVHIASERWEAWF